MSTHPFWRLHGGRITGCDAGCEIIRPRRERRIIVERESETTHAPRIAASSYLNTAPLIWSFTRGAEAGSVRLLTDTAPSRCADMLARGEVSAALVPVIEYQRLTEIEVVPGVCVGARRSVRSVVLVTRGARLEEVRSVALDTSSRTSVALVRLIFREFLRAEPEFASAEPDLRRMLEQHDAALVIGDPAMTFEREGLRVYDLASVWRERTGLGFVFAMWMIRAGEAGRRAREIDFAAARDAGLRQVEEIAAEYTETLRRPHAELLSYLQENICFELDEEMREGLSLYYQLAEKHGLIERARPLKFVRSD